MATKMTKKQQTQLTEKLAGIIQRDNALQLRMSTDTSVNEMNVNQISGALNRIHGQAIGKELPTVINIPASFTGYEIDGIGTIYSGELNIETGLLSVEYGAADLGSLNYAYYASSMFFYTNIIGRAANINCSCVLYTNIGPKNDTAMAAAPDMSMAPMLSTNGQVKFKNLAYTTVSAFKEAMSGVMLVYELATHESYTLTHEQMIQLLDQL